MVAEIREQIEAYCSLRFKKAELDYLRSILWIRDDYVNFLKNWHPDFSDFDISTNAPCGLAIEATSSWLNSSPYEMPVLMIVNEVYFRMQYDYKLLYASFEERLLENTKRSAAENGMWVRSPDSACAVVFPQRQKTGLRTCSPTSMTQSIVLPVLSACPTCISHGNTA